MLSTSTSDPKWKGKKKALNQDEEFLDLNPTITYRHLLSNATSVRDPLRVIALCDSDAFYAACEMVRLGVGPDVPLVVLQWDSLIAVNYPARKYGISRMDKKQDALKRCPHLRVVHVATYKEGEAEPGYWDDVDTNTHKVSLDHYRRESQKIATMFAESLPGCEIEKASIDEAFIDFTKVVKQTILQRYPRLSIIPSDSPLGIDTPLPDPPDVAWDGLGSLIPIHPRPPGPKQAEVEGETNDQSELSDPLPSTQEILAAEQERPTWHDLALSIGAELMGKAREDVRTKLGYSTSAGVSRNKFLAKLTASYKKPNSQSILRNAAIPNYLTPLPFQKIRFLGGKLGTALAKEFEAATVGDLLSIGLDEMQHKFGEESIWIYETLRGVDRNEVKSKGSTLNKSMLASKNLPKPITKPADGYHWIRVLAAELALRLNESRKIAPHLWPKSLVLHARKGYEAGRSKQAPFPFTREVTVDVIASAGDKLWKELVGNSTVLNVSSVQLAFTGIEESDAAQQTIEGFLRPHSLQKRPRNEDDRQELGLIVESRLPDDGKRGSPLTYVCPRCGRVFHLPRESNDNESDVTASLNKLRAEHEDFHFAQDLSKEFSHEVHKPIKPSSTSSNKASTQNTTKKQKKTQSTPKGIEKFFKKS